MQPFLNQSRWIKEHGKGYDVESSPYRDYSLTSNSVLVDNHFPQDFSNTEHRPLREEKIIIKVIKMIIYTFFLWKCKINASILFVI